MIQMNLKTLTDLENELILGLLGGMMEGRDS